MSWDGRRGIKVLNGQRVFTPPDYGGLNCIHGKYLTICNSWITVCGINNPTGEYIYNVLHNRNPWQVRQVVLSLSNPEAKAKVLSQLTLLKNGLKADTKVLYPNLYELRINKGPGYRVYYTIKIINGKTIVLLLGGDKSTQIRDIEKARKMAEEVASADITIIEF